MQHANYGVTAKHYIDRKEVAKQMAKQGFRIFPEQKPKRHSRKALQLFGLGLYLSCQGCQSLTYLLFYFIRNIQPC